MSPSRRPPPSRLHALRGFLVDPPFAVLIAALVLAASWTVYSRVAEASSQGPGAPPSPRTGFSAPDFTLDTLDGGQLTLSELRGQPVMLNVWASWCLPCRVEMPAIEKVYQRHRDAGLVVVGLNVTSQDSETAARAFVQELGLTFPIVLDRDGGASARYELMGLPSTYFIDRNGIIRNVIIGGPMSEGVMLSNVEDLLREP
ncbi:MAG: TlpA disulfide reductase family protein [Chloroflexota bacterium]